MPHRRVVICVLALLTLCPAVPALAAPCGLIGILTADVTDKHVLCPDVVFSPQPGAALLDGGNFTIDTQVGLGGGWEAGFDFLSNDIANGVLNVKKQLKTTKRTQWAFGVLNVSPNVAANWRQITPYVVTTTTAKSEKSRFHFGFQWAQEPQFLVGLDHTLGNDTSLWADYTTGSDPITTVGLDFMISNDLEFTIGAINQASGATVLFTDVVLPIDF